jgi:hypothetical protein
MKKEKGGGMEFHPRQKWIERQWVRKEGRKEGSRDEDGRIG